MTRQRVEITSPTHDTDFPIADLVLVGGGIMSATLGSMLAVLEPNWRIVLLERAEDLSSESSAAWNNAGTGHAGFCELNYMPNPADDAKATAIAREYHLSRQWWSYLAERGLIDPGAFIHIAPHMNIVFGARDVEYLRQRFETLRTNPFFAGMEYTEEPSRIAEWAPLMMADRSTDVPLAATRHEAGTDVDFGALTRALTGVLDGAGGTIRLGHNVTRLSRTGDGYWAVSGRNNDGKFKVLGKRVFAGTGGYALRMLQRAGVAEVDGYGVLPVGAAFFRCSNPDIVARHDAKVYSQAAIGAPPMSVPHMDKRVVDNADYLLFGPYATFSTKLLKYGRLSDAFTTVRWRNIHVIAAALLQNLTLVRYLVKELLNRPRTKFAQLQRFYPTARSLDWDLVPAGQRAQLVKPDRRRIGVIYPGTELVLSSDTTIAGVLGASPGASTAVAIMLDWLRRSEPERWNAAWASRLARAVPGSDPEAAWDIEAVAHSTEQTARALHLDVMS